MLNEIVGSVDGDFEVTLNYRDNFIRNGTRVTGCKKNDCVIWKDGRIMSWDLKCTITVDENQVKELADGLGNKYAITIEELSKENNELRSSKMMWYFRIKVDFWPETNGKTL